MTSNEDRRAIGMDDVPATVTNELPPGGPPLRRKNGVLLLNLPDIPAPWLDTDALLDEIREERIVTQGIQ